MDKQKKPMDYHWVFRFVYVLVFLGLGTMIVTWFSGDTASGELTAVQTVFMVVGFLVIFCGLLLGWTKLRCPYCGKSFCIGGRVPLWLPKVCPNCGKKL